MLSKKVTAFEQAFSAFHADVNNFKSANREYWLSEMTKKDSGSQVKRTLPSIELHMTAGRTRYYLDVPGKGKWLEVARLNVTFPEPISENSLVKIVQGTSELGISGYNLQGGTQGVNFLLSNTHYFNPLFVKGRTLVLDMELLDYNNELFAIVDTNILFLNPKYQAKFNFDDNGLEFIDKSNNVVFSLDVIGQDQISLQGYWIDFNGTAYIIGSSSAVAQPLDKEEFKSGRIAPIAEINRLFDYSTKSLGKRL